MSVDRTNPARLPGEWLPRLPTGWTWKRKYLGGAWSAISPCGNEVSLGTSVLGFKIVKFDPRRLLLVPSDVYDAVLAANGVES